MAKKGLIKMLRRFASPDMLGTKPTARGSVLTCFHSCVELFAKVEGAGVGVYKVGPPHITCLVIDFDIPKVSQPTFWTSVIAAIPRETIIRIALEEGKITNALVKMFPLILRWLLENIKPVHSIPKKLPGQSEAEQLANFHGAVMDEKQKLYVTFLLEAYLDVYPQMLATRDNFCCECLGQYENNMRKTWIECDTCCRSAHLKCPRGNPAGLDMKYVPNACWQCQDCLAKQPVAIQAVMAAHEANIDVEESEPKKARK